MQDQYDDHYDWAYGDHGYGYGHALDYGYGKDYGYDSYGDDYGYDSYGYDSYGDDYGYGCEYGYCKPQYAPYGKTYEPYTEKVWGYGPYDTQYYPSYDRLATSW